MEAPDTWIGPYFDEEIGQTIGSLMAAMDTLLLGRVTYEGFATAFAGQTGGIADQMNNTPRVVVSTITVLSNDEQTDIERLSMHIVRELVEGLGRMH